MNQVIMGNMNLTRRLVFAVLWLAAIGVLATSVGAQDLNRKEGNFVVRDFRFQSGEVLPELRLYYVTLGTPNRDAAGHVTNAVLVLHCTGGSGATFTSKYFAESASRNSWERILIGSWLNVNTAKSWATPVPAPMLLTAHSVGSTLTAFKTRP